MDGMAQRVSGRKAALILCALGVVPVLACTTEHDAAPAEAGAAVPDASQDPAEAETALPEDPPDTTCDVGNEAVPIHGAKCTGDLSCTYSSLNCEETTAVCENGRWHVTLGQCYKCPSPDDRPQEGTPCQGEGCQWLNDCGGRDIGSCTKNGWQILPGACTKACQPERPTPGSPCPAISLGYCQYPGFDCSTIDCLCASRCPTGYCSDGLSLEWFCYESCGPVSD
jgi:hypothetical protein